MKLASGPFYEFRNSNTQVSLFSRTCEHPLKFREVHVIQAQLSVVLTVPHVETVVPFSKITYELLE